MAQFSRFMAVARKIKNACTAAFVDLPGSELGDAARGRALDDGDIEVFQAETQAFIGEFHAQVCDPRTRKNFGIVTVSNKALCVIGCPLASWAGASTNRGSSDAARQYSYLINLGLLQQSAICSSLNRLLFNSRFPWCLTAQESYISAGLVFGEKVSSDDANADRQTAPRSNST